MKNTATCLLTRTVSTLVEVISICWLNIHCQHGEQGSIKQERLYNFFDDLLSKAPSKRSSNAKHLCPICDDAIEDSSSKSKGHDAVFCDGTCNTWLHRGCAGLSKIAFKKVASSSHPFYCTHCSLSEQKKEIEALKGTVEKLSSDFRTVSSMLAKISSEKKSPQEDSRTSQQLKLTTDDSSPVEPPSHKPPSISPRPSSVTQKFNIIVKGLPEHRQGTPQHIRLNNDYGEVNLSLIHIWRCRRRG